MHTLRHTNATLFVTVLSACLGLLIAGVPSQIQAQSVTAKTAGESQSASDVPQCSGLATPEGEKLVNRGVFVRPFLGFVAKVRELIAKGSLDWNNPPDLSVALDKTSDGINTITTTDNTTGRMFSAAIQDFTEDFSADLALDVHNVAFYNQDVAHFFVTFKATDTEFITNVTFEQESPEQAQQLVATYNSAFLSGGCSERGEPAELFYTNTEALAANNQVLIVTRLPRAALTVPLVEKPAAN